MKRVAADFPEALLDGKDAERAEGTAESSKEATKDGLSHGWNVPLAMLVILLPLGLFAIIIAELSLPPEEVDMASLHEHHQMPLATRWQLLQERLRRVRLLKRRIEKHEADEEAKRVDTIRSLEAMNKSAKMGANTSDPNSTFVLLGLDASANASVYANETADEELALSGHMLASSVRASGLLPTARRARSLAVSAPPSPASLASPPPPLGPPVLLRAASEAGCLQYEEPLELLSRARCDFTRHSQRFVWEPGTRTLRLAQDLTQCVDFFASLQDFGVWACFDAGNDEMIYDAAQQRYCLLLDHDKCVRTVTASTTSVMLRVPGDASCLQFTQAHALLDRATCDADKQNQRWRFDPTQRVFASAVEPSLCLDYSVSDQAFAVWQCDAPHAAGAAAAAFEYHKLSGKYCLARSHGASCVREALEGSAIALRLPTEIGCLQLVRAGAELEMAACSPAVDAQRWVFHSQTASFRPSLDATLCLDLFSNGAIAVPGMGTVDDLHFGAKKCQPETAPTQRLTFDRYMSRFCVSSRPDICVQEAALGTHLRLRLPNSMHCLSYAGGIRTLKEEGCDPTDERQMWLYDASTLVFRHAAHPTGCLDFFVAHDSFGVWTCRQLHDVNSQQQFLFDEENDRFCLVSDRSKCVQEATSPLLY